MGRSIVNAIIRDLEKASRAAAREQTRQARELEKAHRDLLRQQALADKERQRLYVESRIEETEERNREANEYLAVCESILASSLGRDPRLNFKTLLRVPELPLLDLNSVEPAEVALPKSHFMPTKPNPLIGWIPWVAEHYDKRCIAARQLHARHKARCDESQLQRESKIQQLQIAHESKCKAIKAQAAAQHSEIKEWIQALKAGDAIAIADYFEAVLEESPYPDGFPRKSRAAYDRASKQLLVEYDLPAIDDSIPVVKSYKYVKTRDEITETPAKDSERRRLYLSLVAQITLRTLHELFASDPASFVDTIALNAHVDTINRATGQPIRPCLVSIRTTADLFRSVNLNLVDPIECLESLSASVSKSPAELAAVRPILEFNMVDRRFIQESDVISTLDQRPNLMELTPGEFESLITNLFQKIGLETKLTQASRDGGVDCVAFDCRPIFGGKVVVQAKRYKNTVGVAAVRDLYGTMINEGASKGILVTTSGFGKAAFEFANGKPIELLSGPNLLHLLEEHSGVSAKIVMPEDWTGL